MSVVCDYIDDDNQGSGAVCGATPIHNVVVIFAPKGKDVTYTDLRLCADHVVSDTGVFSVQCAGDAWTLSDYRQFLIESDELLEVEVTTMTNVVSAFTG